MIYVALIFKYIQPGSGEVSCTECGDQGLRIDHRATGCVDQDGAFLHLCQTFGIDEMVGGIG